MSGLSGDGQARVIVRIPAERALTPEGGEGLRALHETGRVDAFLVARASGPASGAEPTTVAAFLGSLIPGLDLIVEAALEHDYAYNLARRVATLQALAGRAAAILLPADEHDGAVTTQLLWQSWPRQSIIGDRETRTFVDATQIQRVDAGGRRPAAGPCRRPWTRTTCPSCCSGSIRGGQRAPMPQTS